MIRLHHVPFSRSFRVLWLLEELGLEAEVVAYSIRDGSMRRPDLQAASPAGRVPALEIDGLRLFESGAIVQYLAETRAEAGLGCPPGDPERARYLAAIHFAETMGALLEQLNLNHVFLRDPSQASPVVIKLNTRRLAATLAAFDAMLGERAWILERGFSAADTMMGFNLLAAPHFVPLDAYPAVAAYRARMETRPAFCRARARDGAQDIYDRDFYPVPAG